MVLPPTELLQVVGQAGIGGNQLSFAHSDLEVPISIYMEMLDK